MLAFSAAAASAAPPTPGAYKQNDFGGFRNILPPAQGANANSNQIAAFEATGNYPPHTSDQQLSMYSNLLYATPGLQASQIHNFYKDASFGVMPAQVARTYSPRGDVTIERDQFGVPHIYGATRKGTMFGAGYAAGEDRLFMIDALRHAARAQLSSFAGGANAAMDESVWADTPYNEADLQRQYDRADELYGQQGVQIQTDVNNYVAGVNKFISEACANPMKLPGEYNLIAPSQSICLPGHQWKVADVIAIASLVAGIFGKGGGGELGAAQSLETAQQRFGASTGRKVWGDFQSFNDPEAPTTVQGTRFPYGQPPAQASGVAMPDPGTVQAAHVVQSESGSAPASSASSSKHTPALLKPFQQRHDASNALLVSARESASGRPVAVIGPQVGYWSPEILMEEDIHAPATAQGPPIDARGAAFPGANLYVQLGRGRDYSWSATSAGQDIIDTYAVKLCNPNGGQATINSDHYLFRGQCLPFDVLTRTNSWVPTAADQTPAGSETLTTLRTKLGIVIARAKIRASPTRTPSSAQRTSTRWIRPRSASPTSTTRTRCARLRTSCRRRATSPTRSTGSTPTTSTSPTSTPGPTPCAQATSTRTCRHSAGTPSCGRTTTPLLQPRTEPPGRTPARGRPGLPDELEQPAGAGLQHRLFAAVPLAAARRADQARHRRLQEDESAAADQRHGGRRDRRPAGRPGAAVDPEGDRHAAGEQPSPKDRDPAAEGVAGRRRPPHRPE